MWLTEKLESIDDLNELKHFLDDKKDLCIGCRKKIPEVRVVNRTAIVVDLPDGTDKELRYVVCEACEERVGNGDLNQTIYEALTEAANRVK